MHSRVYYFKQVGRGMIIPKVEVEKHSSDEVFDSIKLADYVIEMDINKPSVEEEMEMLSDWGNGKIFNVNKVGAKYFVTVNKEGIFDFVEGNCARLRTMLDDKNFTHDVIKSHGYIITSNFDDRTDIYIYLNGAFLPIFQFIYIYYNYLYKTIGDDALLLTQMFDYHC